MKVSSSIIAGFFLLLLIACSGSLERPSFHESLTNLEGIHGSDAYINSPFVTAGDRVYVIGHQDGSFPDLGWHVTGEMGGIWDHPIKLMDGYRLALGVDGGDIQCLGPAKRFTNFPIANRHEFAPIDGVNVSRVQFVPDQMEGAIVEYELENLNSYEVDIQLQFDSFVDLRPVWLTDRQANIDGRDGFYYDRVNQFVVAKDSLNEWYVSIGSDISIDRASTESACAYERSGLGVTTTIHQHVNLEEGSKKTIRYFIAGSYSDRQSALATMDRLRSECIDLLESKKERVASLAAVNSLKTDNEGFNQLFRWVKYNTDWLVREVPEQGRGLSAGLPDYPWWFGTDNGYAIEGMLAYGMFEDAVTTIDLIIKLSQKVNGESGKIMHEASTNGVVFNPGNLNTTPRFVHALWKTYSWVGADSLADKYWPIVQKSMGWIEAQDQDGNGYPDGPGMMEIPGLHTEMIDVVAYLTLAYQDASRFAEAMGEKNLAASYANKAQRLADKINDEWWVEEAKSFADFRSDNHQYKKLIEGAIARVDTLATSPILKTKLMDELEQKLESTKYSSSKRQVQGHVLHHNWVVNTPMEVGIADTQKAKLALESAKAYRNRFGMYVTGLDRKDDQEQAAKWKSFSYVGAVMTLPTGVQAIAEANYGNIDETWRYLKMLNNSFSYALPGSMYEVSPDFGMVTQAWNAYAVAVPMVNHLIGIKPDAPHERWELNPQLPKELNSIRFSDVRIGDNKATIKIDREGKGLLVQISQSRPDWQVLVRPGDSFSYTAENATTADDYLVLTGDRLEMRWE